MKNKYDIGAAVKVRTGTPTGHCRTPYYLRGLRGRVSVVLGPFLDPEKLGHGLPGYPRRVLYRVQFDQRNIWPDYKGAPGDTLAADILEHWLDPAE